MSNIVIPASVTSIGDEAFGYCKSLSSLVIPDSVTNIGDYAFIVAILWKVLFSRMVLRALGNMHLGVANL